MRSAVPLPCIFVFVTSQRVVAGCMDRIPPIPIEDAAQKISWKKTYNKHYETKNCINRAKLDYGSTKLLSLTPMLVLVMLNFATVKPRLTCWTMRLKMGKI